VDATAAADVSKLRCDLAVSRLATPTADETVTSDPITTMATAAARHAQS
jgi:hypothetical protein